ncbi:MAG: hypothetical protein JSW46_12615 [Gemmatimonadota bacterium]|nr:MAG: hypothetical protein JSW46_12615 [Gemmatimonadota bacterium]
MVRNRVLALAAVLSVLVASPALAQRAGDIIGGVSGGATVGDLFGGSVNTDSRWGGTAGLFAGWRTFRNSVVALEANWVQKGGKGIRLDYIEIPLLVGGVVPAYGGDLRLRGYIGIDLAFKIGCESEVALLDCDRAESTEWSMPFGVMAGRWLDSGRFIALDVRYALGLSDAFETSIPYNRSWQFRLLIGGPLRGTR